MKLPCYLAQCIEGIGAVVGLIALAKLEGLQMMLVLAQELTSSVGTFMTGHFAALVNDPYIAGIGADGHRLTNQIGRD